MLHASYRLIDCRIQTFTAAIASIMTFGLNAGRILFQFLGKNYIQWSQARSKIATLFFWNSYQIRSEVGWSVNVPICSTPPPPPTHTHTHFQKNVVHKIWIIKTKNFIQTQEQFAQEQFWKSEVSCSDEYYYEDHKYPKPTENKSRCPTTPNPTSFSIYSNKSIHHLSDVITWLEENLMINDNLILFCQFVWLLNLFLLRMATTHKSNKKEPLATPDQSVKVIW